MGVSGDTGGERNCNFAPIDDFLCESAAEGEEERSSAVGKRS